MVSTADPSEINLITSFTFTGVMTQELAEGLSLYENNCAKCHTLYDPKKFSAEAWKPILVEMQKNTELNDAQMASISDYINSQL